MSRAIFFCLGSPNALMKFHRFRYLTTYGLQWIQTRHWVLKDHRDLASSYTEPLSLGFVFCQIRALVEDLSLVHPAVGLQHPHEGLGEDRLPGTGLSDYG
jgi:hypothetical protein